MYAYNHTYIDKCTFVDHLVNTYVSYTAWLWVKGPCTIGSSHPINEYGFVHK